MNSIFRRFIPLIVVLSFMFALAACEGQTPIAPASQSSQAQTPSVSVDIGRTDVVKAWPTPAPAEQKIEIAANLLAKNYYFVLDGSGSMDRKACGSNEDKIVVARRALKELMIVVPADANVGFAAFDSRLGTSERVPIGVGHQNREVVRRAIDDTIADGGTPLYNAVVLGYKKLEEQGRRQLGYGEYHLVIVTDGEANQGQDPTKAVNYILANSPVAIHTVGFCIGSDHSLNQKGRVEYKEASNYRSLKQGLEQVLAESPVFDATFFQK
ncbi:MAG: hypothetical protein A3I44_01735 [Candidatus Sungbacteria bacterium RIFCSPLOWO2_02_FULL_51_17]|uniref:VWFA domain-containing protein n=1 Tax=Candidatus Sungbacteria bacterium RIFCSPHIGHO2_02_FULL_51_29 TaxID=1802273 RepID=A0A1G2KXZ3_9BACT|nr:MAG: hypothetical protein A3C16_01505 [Candidatus Sungbacteria bacterium RIFCSPHIGHO2_02_FULL_51_29]OHA10897.1 MAG: hypothetical protein A3I44_01735 [Candidatus Sungbacteria bacterium RIFCSPLOWO2_02_FULL_51_17]